MIPKLFPQTKTQIMMVLVFTVILVTNGFDLAKEHRRIRGLKELVSHQKIGHEFKGLDEFIAGEKYIGYYTDLDLNTLEANKQFAQAQYLLAPTILVPDNFEYEYVLFACSQEIIALRKIQETGAEPLRRNQYGIILARMKR